METIQRQIERLEAKQRELLRRQAGVAAAQRTAAFRGQDIPASSHASYRLLCEEAGRVSAEIERLRAQIAR